MEKLSSMEKLIRKRGQRMTTQKRALLTVFLQQEGKMLSVTDIKRFLPDTMEMDSATIYRNAQNFKNLGLLESMVDVQGITRYTVFDGSHHHHLVCISCGRIINFPCNNPFWQQLAEKNHFKETYHRIEVFGLCSECQQH